MIMPDSTLEERVAALEAQMAAIENNKYLMSYSGVEMEATLDFVNDRKIYAGRMSAAYTAGSNSYYIISNLKVKNYDHMPLIYACLFTVPTEATTRIVETSKIEITKAGLYYMIRAFPTATLSESSIGIWYMALERTDM